MEGDIMGNEFQIERHKALLEERTKQIRRVIFGSVIFGVFLLVNILTPYSKDLNETKIIESKIVAYQTEINGIEASLKPLNELTTVINRVERSVSEKPWDRIKQELISKYHQMNLHGTGNLQVYQREADNAVDSIAMIVNRTVVMPLANFLDSSSIANGSMPGLVQELKTFPISLNNWVNENMGRRWYLTIHEKEATIQSLSNTLDDKLSSLSRAINSEKPNLLRNKDNLLARVNELKSNPTYKIQKDELEKLQDKMEKILPDWIKGMISVEQMVQLFPFIIVVLTIYVFILALNGAFSYRFLAKELRFMEESRSDPGYSSIWTLTYRGTFGTLTTIFLYLLFMLIMWFFFESGASVFDEWLKNGNTWFIDKKYFSTFLWLCRILLIGLMVYTFIYPYSRRREKKAV